MVIVISYETQEEKNDLIYLMSIWNLDYILYSSIKKNNSSKFIRYVYKVADSILFSYFIFTLQKRKKQNLSILGAPCLRNRLASFLLRKKYVCYLRCLHPNPTHLAFLSDKIDFYAKKLGIDNKLTNPYRADKYLITSPINEIFIKYRNPKMLNFNTIIKHIGPIWLRNIKLNQQSHITQKKKRIFYITQSFHEHNLKEANKRQKEIIIMLHNLCKDKGLEFILKVHPRDIEYYDNINIFKGNSIEFLSQLTKEDIIFSAFSTLAFEAYSLGACIQFIVFDHIDDLYIKLYENYDIPYLHIKNSLAISSEDYTNFNLISKSIDDQSNNNQGLNIFSLNTTDINNDGFF